jgi:N-acetylated-alpha-linked acidic dipeptidase
MLRTGRLMPGGLLVLVAMSGCGRQDPPRLPGFTVDSGIQQKELEARIRDASSPKRLRGHRRALAETGPAGSGASVRAAHYFADALLEAGFDTVFRYRYDVPLPRLISGKLTLVSPDSSRFPLAIVGTEANEDGLEPSRTPKYFPFSPDGDVEGEVVYVHHGQRADYRVLDSLGVEVEGRIVLANSTVSGAALAARYAAERGALAMLVLIGARSPDSAAAGRPTESGSADTDASHWPASDAGHWLASDPALHPGDPTTPFRPTLPGELTLPIDEAPAIPKIPVHPVRSAQARRIARGLTGPAVPEVWSGTMPEIERLGPGPVRLHLELEFDWRRRPVVNVVGLLRGATEPDQIVLVGGHRDRWGDRAPVMGTASMLEAARAVTRALGAQSPRRTIGFASWDATGFGAIGSTEYGEHSPDDVGRRVVAYINHSGQVARPFEMAGSPALRPTVNDILRHTRMPGGHETVFESWLRRAEASGGVGVVDLGGWKDIRLATLGPTGDHVVFLNHLGVSSLDVEFPLPAMRRGSGPVASSAAESEEDETGLETASRAAEIVATLALRLANADVLPFDHAATADAVSRDLVEIGSGADTDALEPEWARAQEAAKRLGFRAAQLNAVVDHLLIEGAASMERRVLLVRVNDLVSGIEQALLLPDTLGERTWYRHPLYVPRDAPEPSKGTDRRRRMPALRSAVARGDLEGAKALLTTLEAALIRATERVDEALELAQATTN